MRTLQEQVALRIRQVREQKGVSQEALAAACNLHRTYIGLIERGERNLSLATIERIANGLSVPASELLSKTELPAGTTRLPKKPAPKAKGSDMSAHLATIREVLIDAKIVDAHRYDVLLRKNRKIR